MLEALEPRVLLSGCGPPLPGNGGDASPEPPDNNDWTVLVYMNADNNLDDYAFDDLNEMEAVALPAGVAVLVLVDYFGADNTYRGRIVGDSDPGHVTSPLDAVGELDMGQPQNLTDFLIWGAANYPADHYALVLWDHGRGFLGFGDPEEMEVPEIRSAIEDSAVPIDLLGFSACRMGMTEVAYELRDVAEVFVASETSILAEGWPFDRILPYLAANPSASAAELGAEIVAACSAEWDYPGSPWAISSVALAGIDNLAGAVSSFATLTLATATEADWAALRLACTSATLYGLTSPFYSFRDLGAFMAAVQAGGAASPIRDQAGVVLGLLAVAVDANWTGPATGGQGLSIYLPTQGHAVHADYAQGLAFVADTAWEDFLGQMVFQDDPFEDNDILAEAWYPAADWRRIWLSSFGDWGMQTDDDWYRIEVVPGREHLTVLLEFLHAEGNIDLEVVDSSGVVWASAASLTDDEYIDTILPYAGTWYLRAYGDNQANIYDLRWDALEWNQPPTVTTIDTLPGAGEDEGFRVSYDTLIAASDASDPDGHTVSFRLEDVLGGTLEKDGAAAVPGVTLLGPGEEWLWRPASNANGVTDAFSVRAWDGYLASASAVEAAVEIAPANDLPAADGQSQAVNENADILLTLGAWDVETAYADLAFAVSDPAHGTLTQVAHGQYRYEPDPDYSGPDSFTFTVTDTGDPAGEGASPALQSLPATVEIDVVSCFTQVGKGGLRSFQFPDSDGNQVTVRVFGPGYAKVQVENNQTGDAAAGDIVRLILRDTDRLTRLRVYVASRGSTTIGQIEAAGAMRSIYAPNASLTGGLTVGHELRWLTLGDVIGVQVIDIAGDVPQQSIRKTDKVSIRFDRVADAVITTHCLPITYLRVNEWLAADPADGSDVFPDKITAPRLDYLYVNGRSRDAGATKGDFQADIELAGDAEAYYALRYARIAGNLEGAWQVTGNVRTIWNYGRADGWDITVSAIPDSRQTGSIRNLWLGTVANADVRIQDVLRYAKAIVWSAGSLEVNCLRTLRISGKRVRLGDDIAGDFGATLTIHGQDLDRNVMALRTATVAGTVTGVWSVENGDVGWVTVGALNDAELLLGCSAVSNDDGDFSGKEPRLRSLRFRGVGDDYFTSSVLAAWTIDRLWFDRHGVEVTGTWEYHELRRYIREPSAPENVWIV